MSWAGVVLWRRQWARAVAWGEGLELDRGDRAPGLVGAGYGLDLLEVGYRARAIWDRVGYLGELEDEEEEVLWFGPSVLEVAWVRCAGGCGLVFTPAGTVSAPAMAPSASEGVAP